ncbi:MAG: anaerobic ribonucleoside-triphosphate reductase, partial [Acetatifactor sp.]|nr:anaerobic ribonucleoside-triphosphate reductase [Acetatifactor sp.]
MSSNFDQELTENADYGEEFQPEKTVYVVKKDGSTEAFNVQKVISAVGKSAYRALTKFTEDEERHICQYVIDKVNEMDADQIPIPVMHNIVESALEQVKPVVAKSYRDYRNYKQDFVRMMDDVYKKSQSIMY